MYRFLVVTGVLATALEGLCDKIKVSLEMETKQGGEPESSSPALKQKQEWVTQWPRMKDLLNQSRTEPGETSERDAFLENVQKGIKKSGLDYISVIQGLPPSDAAIGTQWLQGIVDRVVNAALSIIPSFK